jgi:hypothetical protein
MVAISIHSVLHIQMISSDAHEPAKHPLQVALVWWEVAYAACWQPPPSLELCGLTTSLFVQFNPATTRAQDSASVTLKLTHSTLINQPRCICLSTTCLSMRLKHRWVVWQATMCEVFQAVSTHPIYAHELSWEPSGSYQYAWQSTVRAPEDRPGTLCE